MISPIFAVIVIVIALSSMGKNYTQTVKERETQSRIFDLAVNILKQEPTNSNKDLRRWAVETIDAYSTIRLNKLARQSLIETISITGDMSSEDTLQERAKQAKRD
jgi:hypothetical protein